MASVTDTALASDSAIKARRDAGEKLTTNDLKEWWTNVYNMWQQSPGDFQAWASSDPNMATRWYAWAQNKGQNLTLNGEPYSAKQLQADNMALLQSAGVDLKNDGRLYTTNFNTVDDVNSNWGVGDFWKIGSYNTPKNGLTGLLQNVAESPTAIAGIAMAVAMPYLAPQLATAIAGATGWSAAASQAAASAVLSSGMSAANGGDLGDIVTAGALASLPGLMDAHLPQILNSIDPKTADAYNALVASGPKTVEEAQTVWDNLPNIFDVKGAVDGSIPQGNQPTGVKYDMPILNPVVAEPSPTGASGGSQSSPGGTVDTPATPVPPGAPNDPTEAPTGVQDEGQYTWNGTDLINVKTGVKAPRPPSGTWRTEMNKGVLYNEMGEPVGGDEKSGLDLGYLIWASQQGTGVGQGTSPGPGTGPGPGGTGTGQTGTGTGNETPPGSDFDWTKLIPLLALAAPQEPDKEGVPQGNARPQDMSTLYQKPTYAPVEQKGLLEPYGTTYTRQAPSVLPGNNSNQDTFQKWYVDWLKGQNPESGLLPQVSPSTRGLV